MLDSLLQYASFLFVIVVFLALVSRMRNVAVGPVLVLKKLEIAAGEGGPAVIIEGRPSGLLAWLLTSLGLDTLSTFIVTEDKITFKSGSLSGETHRIVPLDKVSSTHCAYSQPIGLLIFGALLLVASLLYAMNNVGGSSGVVLSGVFVAAICGIVFVFQRKIMITVETTGGLVLGIALKPSPIEGVPVDLKKALAVTERINALVLAHAPKLERV